MIPHRLKVKKELIPLVLKKGLLAGSEYLSLRVLNNPNQKEAHFTVIITKKAIKLAVNRHANQRKIYEIIQQILPVISAGVNVLIFPKKDLRDLKNESLKEEILKVFKKAGLVA